MAPRWIWSARSRIMALPSGRRRSSEKVRKTATSPMRPMPRAYSGRESIMSLSGCRSAGESGHGTLDAVLKPSLHGLGHPVHLCIDQRLLLRRRHVQHIVGQVIQSRWLGTHPDPESSVVLAGQSGLDAFEPVVATGGPRPAEPEPTGIEG